MNSIDQHFLQPFLLLKTTQLDNIHWSAGHVQSETISISVSVSLECRSGNQTHSIAVTTDKLTTQRTIQEVLLALSNASRSSELHTLDLRFRQFTPEGVNFRKTRRSGPPKKAFFAKFTDDEALCPVDTMKVYEEKMTM